MSSVWGNRLKISLFGESHGEAIGVVIDGLPPGESIDMQKVYSQMQRRAPGRNTTSTTRHEKDIPEVVSGFFDNKTTGSPLCAYIRNSDQRSSDYEKTKDILRPSHADYPAFVKYKGFADMRGGGHFSGRLTAPIVFAGAVCRQILETRGIVIGAHIYKIGSITDTRLDANCPDIELLNSLNSSDFSVIDKETETKFKQEIERAAKESDSIGGIVECVAAGLPAGIGSPMFMGVENCLSSIIFGIPGVKGIEFGEGFGFSDMRGSQANDGYYIEDNQIKLLSNNNGGILGGITTSAPLVLRVAFKPTPSIALSQKSVNIKTLSDTELTISGRHDPCIVPRAVPVVESAVAIGLMDLMLEGGMI